MSHNASGPESPADGSWSSPWSLALGGLAGLLCSLALGEAAPLLGVLLTAAAMIAAGAALALHLPRAGWDFDGRLLSGALWWLSAAVAFLASRALLSSADSLAMLAQLAALVALLAGVVTLMPTGWRRLVVSLLILLHFALIAVAVTVVPPPNAPAPWLSMQVWSRYARPWLMLTNLNNGYHFYAPEPGPCALLWIRVEFADGASRWVRMPDHDRCRNHLERRRWGALATRLGNTMTREPTPEMMQKRDREAEKYDPVIPPGNLPFVAQYREPSYEGKMLLESLARYVARTAAAAHPGEGAAESPVRGVKIYRVDYAPPPPQMFLSESREVTDPTLYAAWYQGEFDASGRLKDSSKDDLLYWYIPILRVPEPGTRPPAPGVWSTEGKVINFVRIHAGDRGEESVP